MREKLEKKVKTGKVIGILSIVAFLAVCIAIATGAILENDEIALMGLVLLYPFMILGFTYFIGYFVLICNYKWLKSRELEYVVDDIDISGPPQIKAGKTYLGNYALYSKQAKVVIPYSEFAWVYNRMERNGLFSTVSLVIHTKDRRQFVIPNCGGDELKWVIENHVIPVCPRLVVGFGKKQRQRFLEENPKPKK